jgi:hypothetical protein
MVMHKFRNLFLTIQLKMNETMSPGDYINNDEMERG